MQRLRVAYNFWCRAPCNLPWQASVSSHQFQWNIPTFEALLRKIVYLFLEGSDYRSVSRPSFLKMNF